jgi:hypothetical protein
MFGLDHWLALFLPFLLLTVSAGYDSGYFGGKIVYIIDMGTDDLTGPARMEGPADRLSERRIDEEVTFRTLLNPLVYFYVSDFRLQRATSVDAYLRFRGDVPETSVLRLGVSDSQGWNFSWRDASAPIYDLLLSRTERLLDDRFLVVSSKGPLPVEYTSASQFVKNVPAKARVATNAPELLPLVRNFDPMPDERKAIVWQKASGLAAFADYPQVAVQGMNSLGISLRGDILAYALSLDGSLDVSLIKKDLNRYAGLDEMELRVYSPSGRIVHVGRVPDDGVAVKTDRIGAGVPYRTTIVTDEVGVFVISIRDVSLGQDQLVTDIAVNQQGVVFRGPFILAGNLYGDEPVNHPVSLYFHIPEKTTVRFTPVHDGSMQTVWIIGNSFERRLFVYDVSTPTEVELPPGSYYVKFERGDIRWSTDVPVSFEPERFFSLERAHSVSQGGVTHSYLPMRGTQLLSTWLSAPSLSFVVFKQDLNWYEGEDVLDIRVRDQTGRTLLVATVPDDGDTAASWKSGPVQRTELRIELPREGLYRIYLEANQDIILKGWHINTDKVVYARRAFVAGFNPIYPGFSYPSRQAAVYLLPQLGSGFRIRTPHPNGLQTFAVADTTNARSFELSAVNADLELGVSTDPLYVRFPNQDVIIEGPLALAVTANTAFIYQDIDLVPFSYDIAALLSSADYVIVDFTRYVAPRSDDGWFVARVRWSGSEFLFQNQRLLFVINTPFADGSTAGQIDVDWIRLEFHVPPFWGP